MRTFESGYVLLSPSHPSPVSSRFSLSFACVLFTPLLVFDILTYTHTTTLLFLALAAYGQYRVFFFFVFFDGWTVEPRWLRRLSVRRGLGTLKKKKIKNFLPLSPLFFPFFPPPSILSSLSLVFSLCSFAFPPSCFWCICCQRVLDQLISSTSPSYSCSSLPPSPSPFPPPPFSFPLF